MGSVAQLVLVAILAKQANANAPPGKPIAVVFAKPYKRIETTVESAKKPVNLASFVRVELAHYPVLPAKPHVVVLVSIPAAAIAIVASVARLALAA